MIIKQIVWFRRVIINFLIIFFNQFLINFDNFQSLINFSYLDQCRYDFYINFNGPWAKRPASWVMLVTLLQWWSTRGVARNFFESGSKISIRQFVTVFMFKEFLSSYCGRAKLSHAKISVGKICTEFHFKLGARAL